MIKEETIIAKINELPDKLKQEVFDYIEFLQEKYARQTQPQKLKKRQAGSAKGKYQPAPDFDAPLEDFKVCM